MNRPTFLGLALVATCTLQAQEHPFLAAWELTELEGAIRLDWTILGGSTCDGQVVERSSDGVNFTAVHTISGLCGDPNIALGYSWTDASPPEFSVVHYRVMLGLEGYSSVKAIRFDQLRETDLRVFPDPADAWITLVVDLPGSASVDLTVFDAQGRRMLEWRGHQGPRFELDLANWPAGTYAFLAEGDGRRFTGRFVRR
jgi:hypothetical protein